MEAANQKTARLLQEAMSRAAQGNKVIIVARNQLGVDALKSLLAVKGVRRRTQKKGVLKCGDGEISFLTADSGVVDLPNRRVIGTSMQDTFFHCHCFA